MLYLDRAEAYWHLGHYAAATTRLARAVLAEPSAGVGVIARVTKRALKLG
jgi:hypothetical protein